MVVGAVKDNDPPAIPFVRQPAVYELWDVGRNLVSAGQLDGVGNGPEAFFDVYLYAGIDPEHPSLGFFRDLVGEFDGQLRFTDAGQLPSGGIPKLGLPNAAEADQGHAAGRFEASLAKTVENIAAVDEIAVAAEGDGWKRLWRRFRSFWRKRQQGDAARRSDVAVSVSWHKQSGDLEY